MMKALANWSRPAGDPQIIETGPSSLHGVDRVARLLGWFSLGLGAAEVFAGRRIGRALGVEGLAPFIRACGAREIATGIVTLSPDKQTGLWARVGGDALDLLALASALSPRNRERHNVETALAAVAAITAIDVFAAVATTRRHARSQGRRSDYSHRSGYPRGLEHVRGAARDDRRQSRQHDTTLSHGQEQVAY